MPRAASIIQQEHLNYTALLQCLGQLADEASESRSLPDLSLFHSIIEYIECFLNRFHHPKEEDYLFRVLLMRHPKSKSVIERLQREHAQGEELLIELKSTLKAGEGEGGSDWISFADAVGRYREHQYNHMRSEEEQILPLALKHLTARDWGEIDAAFSDHDDPLFGDERTAAYRRLYSKIIAMAPVPYGFAGKAQ